MKPTRYYVIESPDKTIDKNSQSIEGPEMAWHRFCYPALDRSAYEEEGFKPVYLTEKQIKRRKSMI